MERELRIIFELGFVALSAWAWAAPLDKSATEHCERLLAELRSQDALALDTPTLRRGFNDFWRAVLRENEIQRLLNDAEMQILNKKPLEDVERSIAQVREIIGDRVIEAQAMKQGPLANEVPRMLEVQRVLLRQADELQILAREHLRKEPPPQEEQQGGQDGEQENGDQDGEPSDQRPASDQKSDQQGGKTNDKESRQENGQGTPQQDGEPSDQRQASNQKSDQQGGKTNDKESRQENGQETPKQNEARSDRQSEQENGDQDGDQNGEPSDQKDKNDKNDKNDQQGGKDQQRQASDQKSDQQGNQKSRKESRQQNGQSKGQPQRGQKDGGQSDQQGNQSHRNESREQSGRQSDPSEGEQNSQGREGIARGKDRSEYEGEIPHTREISTDGFDDWKMKNDGDGEGGYSPWGMGKKGFGESLSDGFRKRWGSRKYHLGDDTLENKEERAKNRLEAKRGRENLERLLGKFFGTKSDFGGFGNWRSVKFDSAETLRLVGAFVEHQWVQTLRRYDSLGSVQAGLLNFRDLVKRLSTEYSGTTILPDFQIRAGKLYDELVNLKGDYRSLPDISGQALNFASNPKEAAANLASLRKILTELRAIGQLSPEESTALDALNKILTEPTKEISDQDLASAFVRSLTGPLSLTSLQKKFPGSGADRIDYGGLAKAMRNGQVDTYLYLSRLSAFLDFFKLRSMIPRHLDRPDGMRLPIENKPFDLEAPLDLNSFQSFYVNGPPNLIVERFLAGDILEMTYRQDRQTTGVTKEREKVVDFALFDVSSSMKDDSIRSQIQASLMGAQADLAQLEEASGLADHILYAMPFGTNPGVAVRYEGSASFQGFFEQNLANPPIGSSGTNFTAALNRMLGVIGEEAAKDPSLKRANLLMITDGEDTSFKFEYLQDAADEVRKKIPEIELSLAVVAIDSGNSQMAEALKDGEVLKVFDRFQYRHITEAEIKQLFTREAILKHFEHLGGLLGSISEVNLSVFLQLHSALGHLEVNRISTFNWDHLETERALNAYQPKEQKSELDRVFEILFWSELPPEMPVADQKVERLNLLSTLLQILGKEKGLPPEEMWGNIGAGMHERIKTWVNTPRRL